MTKDEDRHADEVQIAFQMGAEWQRDRMRARIKELEAEKAAWKGIHEGAVLAMQGRIKELEAAIDDLLQYVSRADWHYLKPETIQAMENKAHE